MKTLLIVATSLSLLGAAAAQAQPQGYDNNRDHRVAPTPVRGHADNGRHTGWARGQRLPQEYRGGSYVVTDWRARHLRQPARGYRWVRVDNNYVLASVATGLIANVLAGR
jgi:Ni/Co efflux regulator RcnB